MSESAGAAGIEVADLKRSFDGVVAVDVPHLAVGPRSTLALIGPSGCGKSTLLRLAIGLITPEQGRIAVAGHELRPGNERQIRLRTGYVIQEGGLFPHLTARDNVALVARDQGWPEARITARIEELVELTRLPRDVMGRYPAQMSGGQRQRVALMRALMLDPEVLLLDEPLAALDPMIRSELQRELRRVFERLRKTVLFVTHDMGEAAYVGDEIALMRAGRILQRGTFDALTQQPADPFVIEFIRAQRMAHAPGVLPE
jgi:osmoprotectant transport system ATP-binding protein